MSIQITERIEFSTAAQLVEALQKLAGPGLISLDTLYIKDADGEELRKRIPRTRSS